MAQELCVKAFLADLVEHCQTQRVVIMLDAYEKCAPKLQQWLIDQFLEGYCFNLEQRPPQLVIVLAGERCLILKISGPQRIARQW